MRRADENEPPQQNARESLAGYILPSAGTIVGLCGTLIGFVKINEPRMGESRVDELSAIVALVFLLSGVSAYLAIRYKHRPRFHRRFEQIADLSFLVGLVSLATVILLFAYELA